MDANQLGRRNLTPDAFKLLLGRRYNRMKRQDGGHGNQRSGDQIDTPKTADRLAADRAGFGWGNGCNRMRNGWMHQRELGEHGEHEIRAIPPATNSA